ncbi:MAG: SemiSWEET transporter [Rhodospirillales bacterium]|nr:SemiSWEET transporter [Rhodospirillales bacterium]
MNVPYVEMIGTVAGICSTSSFVPQVLKAWREQDTKAISKRMHLITVTAFSLWIVYGVLIGSVPIIVFNTASLILSGTVLVLTIRRRRAVSVRRPVNDDGWQRGWMDRSA